RGRHTSLQGDWSSDVCSSDLNAGKIVQPAHPYFGQGWSWPWIGRPVAHYYASTGQGAAERDSEILGLPNPFIWWPAFAIGFLALDRKSTRLNSSHLVISYAVF